MSKENEEKNIKLDRPHTVEYIKKLKEQNKDKKIISMSGKEY